MINQNGRATLTAALVADRRAHLVDRLFSPQPAVAEPPPAISLFPAKCSGALAPKRRPAALAALPGQEPRSRLSLRVSQDQLWRLRLAAAYLRQSCQAFVADALDRQIARLAADPAHASLCALLGTPMRNG